MSKPLKTKDPVIISTDDASDESSDNSLLPMLIWGLVLIIVGAVVIMYFV